MRILLGDDRSPRRTGLAAGLLVGAAVFAGLFFAPAAPAQDLDTPPNGVELKTAIERHYAEKIRGLLAPSFTAPPAVSVEVELNLDTIRTSISKDAKGGRSVETVVKTPGAVRTRSIAVAVPAEELPVGFGLSTFRSLIEKGVALGPDDHLELVAMPFRPQAPADGGDDDATGTMLAWLPAAMHVLWAVVALVLGLLCWSAARRFADREPMPSVPAWPPAGFPLVAADEPPAAQTPTPEPEKPQATAAAKPQRMRDPVTAVRRAADRDPARVADALKGWIEG